uniref:Uncharacterized protein n=1 Tax=viral metagenome TaxID=1070528 RepID=A0A6C0J873_9ZZZZ
MDVLIKNPEFKKIVGDIKNMYENKLIHLEDKYTGDFNVGIEKLLHFNNNFLDLDEYEDRDEGDRYYEDVESFVKKFILNNKNITLSGIAIPSQYTNRIIDKNIQHTNIYKDLNSDKSVKNNIQSKKEDIFLSKLVKDVHGIVYFYGNFHLDDIIKKMKILHDLDYCHGLDFYSLMTIDVIQYDDDEYKRIAYVTFDTESG